MRLNIKKIIEILNCDEDFANKVEYEMECSDFDFSEATNAEFKQEVNYAVFDMSIGETV